MPPTTELIQAREVLRSGLGRTIREKAGLSYADVGAEMKPPVPGSTVWRWEHGVSRPRRDKAGPYLAALKRIQDAPGALDSIEA
jgi:hypothetical protein